MLLSSQSRDFAQKFGPVLSRGVLPPESQLFNTLKNTKRHDNSTRIWISFFNFYNYSPAREPGNELASLGHYEAISGFIPSQYEAMSGLIPGHYEANRG